MTVVLIKKGNLNTWKEDDVNGYREKMAINKPKKEAWNIFFPQSFHKEPTLLKP